MDDGEGTRVMIGRYGMNEQDGWLNLLRLTSPPTGNKKDQQIDPRTYVPVSDYRYSHGTRKHYRHLLVFQADISFMVADVIANSCEHFYSTTSKIHYNKNELFVVSQSKNHFRNVRNENSRKQKKV